MKGKGLLEKRKLFLQMKPSTLLGERIVTGAMRGVNSSIVLKTRAGVALPEC